MKIKAIILFLLFLFAATYGFASTDNVVTFKGTVTDLQTNEPVISASLYVSDYQQGTVSNTEGEFVLTVKNFEPAKNKLTVSCVGYKTEIIYLNATKKDFKIKLQSQS